MNQHWSVEVQSRSQSRPEESVEAGQLWTFTTFWRDWTF
jgi:hypothetical protein